MPSKSSKNRCWEQRGPNLARCWPPQDGPKLGPRWGQNRSKTGLGSEVGSRTDSGPILDRFWDDFGPILGGFWVHVWLIFGSFWLRLGCFWLLFCIELPYKHAHRHVRRFIHARAHTCPQITYMSCNANALPVPCSHRFILGLFFSVLFSVSFSLRSWAGLEPNMAPTWAHFGAMLATFWDLFGCCFGIFI